MTGAISLPAAQSAYAQSPAVVGYYPAAPTVAYVPRARGLFTRTFRSTLDMRLPDIVPWEVSTASAAGLAARRHPLGERRCRGAEVLLSPLPAIQWISGRMTR